MNRLVLSGVVVLAVSTVLVVWQLKSSPPLNSPGLDTPSEVSRSSVPDVKPDEFTAVIQHPAPNADDAEPDQSTFWHEVIADEQGLAIAPPLRVQLAEHRLVTYDAEHLRLVKESEKIELWVPVTGEQKKVWIEEVRKLKSGNLSIKGSVDGDSQFPFVLTLGKESLLATFGTENGVYDVKGNRTHAWIVPVAALRKHRSFDKPDYRIKTQEANGVNS